MPDNDPDRYRIFVLSLDLTAQTHEQWLSIVRFGEKTLTENQPVLVEIIWNEVGREQQRNPAGGKDTEVFMRILAELNLKLATGEW